MKEKSLSFSQGKGNLGRNNRNYKTQNADSKRTKDNIIFIKHDLGNAYEFLFSKALEQYNSRQERSDRIINHTYFEHLFGEKPSDFVKYSADKRKSYYEDVVQIGCMEDSGFETEDYKLVADCLTEYMNSFQKRNPNFYVFNAVLHMDEATPHLHIDYIPVGHFKRGLPVQNSLSRALNEMGYGKGIHTISRWRTAEIDALTKICISHGIQPSEPGKSRGSMSVDEYKEYRKIREQRIKETEKLKSILTEVINILLKLQNKSCENIFLQTEISDYINRIAELETEISELRTTKNRT